MRKIIVYYYATLKKDDQHYEIDITQFITTKKRKTEQSNMWQQHHITHLIGHCYVMPQRSILSSAHFRKMAWVWTVHKQSRR